MHWSWITSRWRQLTAAKSQAAPELLSAAIQPNSESVFRVSVLAQGICSSVNTWVDNIKLRPEEMQKKKKIKKGSRISMTHKHEATCVGPKGKTNIKYGTKLQK